MTADKELFIFLGDRKNLEYFKDKPGYAGAIRLTHDELKTNVKFPEDAPLLGSVGFYMKIHDVPEAVRTIYVERKGYYLSFFMQCVNVYGLQDRKVILFENRNEDVVEVADNFSGVQNFAVLGSRESLTFFKDRPGFISGIYSGKEPDDEMVLSMIDLARVSDFPKTVYVEADGSYLNYFLQHAYIEGLTDREIRIFQAGQNEVKEWTYAPSSPKSNRAEYEAELPKVFEIDLANQCNLKCTMCHISYMGDQRAERLSIDSLRGVKNSFVQIGGVYEPLLHKEFLDIIRLLSSNNCEISLITNATLLNSEMIKELAACNFYSIHVSFDSAVKKTYEDIRRGAKFEKVTENMLMLRKAFRGKETRFLINMVLMRSNIDELREMVDFAHSAGFDGLGFIPMVIRNIRDEKVISESLDPVMDYANARLDEAAEHAISSAYDVVLTTPYYLYTPLKARYPKNIRDGAVMPGSNSRTYFNKYTALQLGHHPEMPHNCVSPFTFAKINPDGKVYICNEITIGDVRQKSLEQIWPGRIARYVRRFIIDNPESCHGCERYKFCLNPRAVNKYDPSNVTADPALQERLRNAVKEKLRARIGFEGANNSFIEAVVNNDADKVRALAPVLTDVNARDNVGSTLLLYTSLYGYKAETEMLIGKGADVNLKNIYSDTPLTASLLGGHRQISELLIAAGANVDHAMSYAVIMDNLEWAKLLADNGADLNRWLNDEHNYLISAAITNNLQMLRFLLSRGADPDAGDINGSTALVHASLNGLTYIAEALVESGADVNRMNNYGDTPLSVATAHGRQEIAEFLIAKGADLSDAMLRASAIGSKSAVEFLVSKGADARHKATEAVREDGHS